MDVLEFLATYSALVLFGGVLLVCMVGLIYRLFTEELAKPKKEKAVVFDKYTSENTVYDVKWRKGVVDKTYYTVCFDVNGRIKKFFVTPLAYDYMHKGLKGTLIYKGNKFIDFDI